MADERALPDKRELDEIEFGFGQTEWGEAITILINGTDMIALLEQYELRFIDENHAGNYMGLMPGYDLPYPEIYQDNFIMRTPSEEVPSGKSLILTCRCGEPGCGAMVSDIKYSGNKVTWEAFEEPHLQDEWNYDEFGPFVFDREQYEGAVAALR